MYIILELNRLKKKDHEFEAIQNYIVPGQSGFKVIARLFEITKKIVENKNNKNYKILQNVLQA